jgi:hypothetical protein
MPDNETASIDPALASEIEDVIMFGRDGDLEALIDNIADDQAFPSDLRNGLESLSYFRRHYGDPAPVRSEGRKAVLMEQSWAMDWLDKVRARIAAAVKRA